MIRLSGPGVHAMRCTFLPLLLLVLMLAAHVTLAADDGAPAPATPPESEPSLGDGDPEASCAREAAQAIQTRYDDVRDITARFEQTTRSVMLGQATLGEAAPYRGVVVFAKPGRMRWSYEEPERSTMVTDGKTLWLYDESAAEVQRLPVEAEYLTGAALQFLLGDGVLLEEFEVSAKRCGDDTVELLLVPRKESSYLSLGLEARTQSHEIVATTVEDLFGNVTHIAFSDLQLNTDPAPATFLFVVPDGVGVIDLVPPP